MKTTNQRPLHFIPHINSSALILLLIERVITEFLLNTLEQSTTFYKISSPLERIEKFLILNGIDVFE